MGFAQCLLLLWTLSVLYGNLYVMETSHNKAGCILQEIKSILPSNNVFHYGILEVTMLSHTHRSQGTRRDCATPLQKMAQHLHINDAIFLHTLMISRILIVPNIR